MSRRIYFFTFSFPFGVGEQWKLNELRAMSQQFSRIEIIPNNYDGNHTPVSIDIDNVFVQPPLFERDWIYLKLGDLRRILFSRYIFLFLKEFIRRFKVFNKHNIISLLSDAINSLNLIEHKQIQKIINDHSKDDIFYFFWGRKSSLLIPFLKRKIRAKTFVRFHRYDLYESRSDNYIPFRRFLLEAIDVALVISKDGFDYLSNRYPSFNKKIVLNRLGTLSKGTSRPSEDGVLRIFSCSSLTPVKRVTMLANAIKLLRFPVEWIHIGTGPLEQELFSITDSFTKNTQFKLTGWIKADDIFTYYVDKNCDLFVNVSESEGIPVSIMEAFSASIPAIATSVGGVPEIVNSENGRLVNIDIKVEELAGVIEDFNKLSVERKAQLRMGAYKTYSNTYNATKNGQELVNLFTSTL